jgi:tetratricopeptide (TPR) repeat protein
MGPKNPQVLYNLGLIALKKESYGEAIQNLQAAVEADPGMAKAYTRLGDAYYLSGMQNEAGKSWGKALQLDPKDRVAQAKLQSLQQNLSN